MLLLMLPAFIGNACPNAILFTMSWHLAPSTWGQQGILENPFSISVSLRPLPLHSKKGLSETFRCTFMFPGFSPL